MRSSSRRRCGRVGVGSGHLAGLALTVAAACSPPPAEAPVVAAAPPPAATATATAAPAEGRPVLVPQRLARTATLAGLSPRGDLLLATDRRGAHVFDAVTGEVRGTLGGCVDEAVFAGDGRSVVALCKATPEARIWDLATDAAHRVKLAVRGPELIVPPNGSLVMAAGEGWIDVIDPARGSVQHLDTGHRRAIWRVHTGENGWMVATDREAVTVFGPTGKVTQTIGKGRDTTAFSLGAPGRRLALADRAGISTFDLEHRRELGRITPCGDGRVDDVEWTEDEDRLLVTCGPGTAPARVILVGADGTEERELTHAPRSRFFVRPRGDRVAVTHNDLGAIVFEIPTGREIARVTPPRRSRHDLELTLDFSRFLFRGSDLGDHAVLDASGAVVSHPPELDGADISIGSTAGLVRVFETIEEPRYFDPSSGKLLPDAHGELAADGATYLSRAGGFALIDRHTGARRPLAIGGAALASPPELSEGGAWVMLRDEPPKGPKGELRLRLVDAHTGKEASTIPLVGQLVAWSAGDALLAVAAPPEGRGCADKPRGRCGVVRVFEARSGRPLATIRPQDSVEMLDFTGGGRLLRVNYRVHDARSGRHVWTLPATSAISLHVAARGQFVLEANGRAQVVDDATGNLVRELDGFGAVEATSRNAAWALTTHADTTWLWETATWTKREVSLSVGDLRNLTLADDGRFAYHADGATLVMVRLSDGATLRLRGPSFDVPLTADGVFDPAQAGRVPLRVRRGPDVARSAMDDVSALAAELGHPGLYADFIAGKPIARAR